MKIVIGIFGIQGAIVDHEIAIKKSAEKLEIDFEIIKVKTKEDVEIINCLIIPGGESTTMRLLGQKNDVIDKINLSIDGGLPVFGTCAGAILLSKNVKR
jgi:5'-phosphate synthase pdxT subunit